MEEKLRIVLDADGVLADTMTKVLTLYNQEYGETVSLSDVHSWHLNQVEKPGTSMRKYFNQPGFFRDLEPLPGAREAVREMAADGHDLFVATISPPNGLQDKFQWIREHFPEIPPKNILLVGRKDLISCTILLDDHHENLIPGNHVRHPLLFDSPWNQNVPEQGFRRVFGWEDFLRHVRKIDDLHRRAS